MSIWQKIISALKRNSPEIVIGIGVGGFVTTTILAVKQTPKAMKELDIAEKAKGEKLTFIEKVKTAGKCYILPGIIGLISTACIIGGAIEQKRRLTALTAACGITEAALTEYRDKVKELLGERKEKEVTDTIAEDQIRKNPPTEKNTASPIIPENAGGTTLCYDTLFGRYFYSDKGTIERTVNKLNRQMTTSGSPFVSYNEFYMELNAKPIDIGELLGWNMYNDNGLIEVSYSAVLTDDGRPCLALTFLTPPDYKYNKDY